MDQPAYCTILARNYLPKALSLARSLQRHGSPHPLNVCLIDIESDADLPAIDGVRWIWPEKVGLTKRQVHDFAMSYNLVEFATAVKPLVLGTLLEEFEQVVYLDPDTWVTAPLDDLAPALSNGPGGIILTPHYLDPNPGVGGFTEGHLLRVGVFNLGFCGVDRRARDFLTWWWDHLSTECLLDPLAALFVDQKWIDIGATLFDATTLRHYGYNVGVGNLHERTIERNGEGGYHITNVDQPLRLFHFHAFDPDRPDQLYTRSGEDTADMLAGSEALADLARDYGAEVRSCRDLIGPQPPYVYNSDASGRPVGHRLRTAYRSAALPAPGSLPSAFDPADADAFAAWRKQAWRPAGRLMFSDVAKGLRYALPEEYAAVKRKVPGLTKRLRGKYMEKTGMWA